MLTTLLFVPHPSTLHFDLKLQQENEVKKVYAMRRFTVVLNNHRQPLIRGNVE